MTNSFCLCARFALAVFAHLQGSPTLFIHSVGFFDFREAILRLGLIFSVVLVDLGLLG